MREEASLDFESEKETMQACCFPACLARWIMVAYSEMESAGGGSVEGVCICMCV